MLEEKPWFKSWPEGVKKTSDYPRITLIDHFERVVKKKPEMVYLTFSGVHYTFREIDELSDICNEGYSNRQAEITQDQIPYADTLMDWSKAMKYCGDETVIKRIANSILVDVRRNLELLGEYATQENFKDARIYQ